MTNDGEVVLSRLIHLAARDQWKAAQAAGEYWPAEYEREGFIHLSGLHHVLTPANAFYRGRNDLVALVVDARLLAKDIVWELGPDTEELFPHLYCTLETNAVLHEIDFAPCADGTFALPPELVRACSTG